MKIGTVTGAVWATKKSPGLAGQALLCVALDTGTVVAADLVGAGKGEHVIVTFGSGARLGGNGPVDAAIIGILDETGDHHVGQ